MRLIVSVLVAVCVFGLVPAYTQDAGSRTAEHSDFDETSRFIFYSVLEGLYEDGLSTRDVEQILMKKEGQSYFNFIYACPICTATIWALQTYQARPSYFYGLKTAATTFGRGLSEKQRQQLYSDASHERLIAINTLMQGWMEKRMDRLNLPPKERADLLEKLEKKRKEGMEALESFRRYEHGANFGVPEAAPAYVNLEECAVCNGAVGKVMKLPDALAPASK